MQDSADKMVKLIEDLTEYTNSTYSADMYLTDIVDTANNIANSAGDTNTVTGVMESEFWDTDHVKGSFIKDRIATEKTSLAALSGANKKAMVDSAFEIAQAFGDEVNLSEVQLITGFNRSGVATTHDDITGVFSNSVAQDIGTFLNTHITGSNTFATAGQINVSMQTAAKLALDTAKAFRDSLKGQKYWDDLDAAATDYSALVTKMQGSYAWKCGNADIVAEDGSGADWSAASKAGCSNEALAKYYAEVAQEIMDTYNEMAASAISHETALKSWYSSEMSQAGDTDTFIQMFVNDVQVKINEYVDEAEEAWSDYQSNGYYGVVDASATSAGADQLFKIVTAGSGTYGCSGLTVTNIKGKTEFGAMAAALDICDHLDLEPFFDGSFFSEFLGYFERYSMYIPPGVCSTLTSSASGAQNMSEISASGTTAEFVYMLHGWGGDNTFLHYLARVMDWVFRTAAGSGFHYGASDGFLVLAPADGSTPMASRTWYLNNDFTGYHMDMIVFELPSFVEDSLGLVASAEGYFGFSMGGWGSFHIAMTYPSQAHAIATFNAPSRPAACHSLDICHLECGVDFHLCDMVWTSSQIAMNPYVVVGTNAPMQSQGSYMPIAIGTLALIVGQGGMYAGVNASSGWTADSGDVIRCAEVTAGDAFFGGYDNYESSDLVYLAPAALNSLAADDKDTMSGFDPDSYKSGTYTTAARSVARFTSVGYNVDMGSWDTSDTGTSCTAAGMLNCLAFVFTDVAWEGSSDTYFYLDPVYFTMATSFFDPTHNVLTDAVTSPHNADFNAYDNYYNTFPYARLARNHDIFATYPIFMLIACDANDEFMIGMDSDSLTALMSLVLFYRPVDSDSDSKNTLYRSSGWIYDKNELVGHSYSQRDIRLSIQWFSDIFRTATSLGDKDATTLGQYTAAELADIKGVFDDATDTPRKWTPCFLFQEYGTCSGAFKYSDVPQPPAHEFDDKYMELADLYGYEYDSAGTHNCMEAASAYGGSIELGSGNTCGVTFATNGHPDGIYPDIIAADDFVLHGNLNEVHITAETIHDLNMDMAEKLCGSSECTSEPSINLKNMHCWKNADIDGETFTYSSARKLLSTASFGPSTCCSASDMSAGSAAYACLEQLEAMGFTVYDCCPDQAKSIMSDSNSFANEKYIDDSWSSAEKTAFEDSFDTLVDAAKDTEVEMTGDNAFTKEEFIKTPTIEDMEYESST